MKHLFYLLFSLVCLTAVEATAQEGHPRRGEGRPQMDPEQIVKQRTSMLIRQLNLNQEQAVAVYLLQLDQMEQMQAAFHQPSGDRAAMRAQMQAMQANYQLKMQEILTEEQFKKWQAAEQERRERGPQGPPQGRPQSPPPGGFFPEN